MNWHKFNQNSYFVFLVVTTLLFSLILLVPNYRHFPIDGAKDIILVIAHWSLSSFGILMLISFFAINKYLFLILFPPFILISSITAYFVWQIDVSINAALVESVFLTDAWEISSYISFQFVVFIILSLLLAALAVIWRFKVSYNKTYILISLGITLISFSVFSYTNKIRKDTLVIRAPFSYFYAYNEYIKIQGELKKDRILIGKDSSIDTDSMLVILVIGEALRADHLQMNGYDRITMPLMEERNVVSFPNIFSPYTHTAGSLRYFLTRADKNFDTPMFAESSFINAFNVSGFHTSWIGNQNPMSSFVYFLSECDTVIINKPEISDYSNMQKLDLDLIPHFNSIVELNEEKQLIILHLAGNHWWYNKNFNDEFAFFQPILESRNISVDNRERMINSYDNVTRLVDYVLESFIQKIEHRKSKMIFLSDHGQSFGENGKWLHANDNPPEQNPACFFWFSEEYQLKNHENIQNIKDNQFVNFDTSFLFHTILHGSYITTSYRDLNYSFFSHPSLLSKENIYLEK